MSKPPSALLRADQPAMASATIPPTADIKAIFANLTHPVPADPRQKLLSAKS